MSSRRRKTGDGVAVIGMAGIFPGAGDVAIYWQNILNKVDCVGEPPPEWGSALYLDPQSVSNDRVYCARGGYLGKLAEFDPLEHGVMPNAVDGTEPDHFLALRVAKEALADAGCLDRELDRERTEVIIGRGSYVNRGNTTAIQHGLVVDQVIRILSQLHPEHSDAELADIKRKLTESLPPFHAETAPGLVPNIISGRIANRLDFMGANFIVDAACASSLVAIDLGMRDLLSGRCDLAVVGGVHASTPPPIVMIFCHLNAISRRGEIRPFDRDADGTLLGEGVGMVVLKRLSDAERDADRIYAVLKGVGVASDGRAVGLLAPRLEGEILALRRAYEQAGVNPGTVGLLEAHGTGTRVGDGIELKALNDVFGTRRRELPSCALGSVKSMISHLMPAAGIAGFIKTVLALHHKVLPPTIHCETPNPDGDWARGSFYLNGEVRPWIHGSADTPRRAGVNAFGFGGINAHAILEEYDRDDEAGPGFQHQWDSEVLVLSAPSRDELLEAAERLRDGLTRTPDVSLKDLAFTLQAGGLLEKRLAVVATSVDDLRQKLALAVEKLANPECARIRDLGGIHFTEHPLAKEGKLAMVFPGEGSQYPNMLADLCVHIPPVRRAFDLMDRAFSRHPRTYLPSETIFPIAGAQDRLWEMDSGAEAVFTGNQAVFALLDHLGIRADAMLGHSTGEHSALLASSTLRIESEEELIEHVLGVNAIYEQLVAAGDVPGAMLMAVGGADLNDIRRLVEEATGDLFVAMDNCPHQIVLCGRGGAVERAAAVLEQKGAICEVLPFRRAYHTPWFEVFVAPLREYFRHVRIQVPTVPVYSCLTAERYPEAPDEVRSLAAGQWARPVRFRETIEKMYDDGVRIFVEAGPRGNLVAFIKDILRGKEFIAVPANVEQRSGLTQLHHLIAELAAHGVEMDLAPLYARRAPRRIDFEPGTAPQAGAGRRMMPIATGLQPVRLPATFRLASRASAPPPPQPHEGLPAVGVSGVVARHLDTMGEFLRLNEEMLGAYLRRKAAHAEPTPSDELPFWGVVTEHVPGRRIAMVRGFDLRDDILFRQHTLGRDVSEDDPALTGLPVVPLTITMEILGEAASRLMPRLRLVGMADVRAYRWITLEDPSLRIRISAVVRTDDTNRVDAKVHELRPNGEVGPVLAEGTMVFASGYPPAPPAGPFDLEDRRPSTWTPDRLYTEGMFHGPCFQAVLSVETSGTDGNESTFAVLPRSDLFRDRPQPAFVTDPVILDAAGQAVAFWSREHLDPGADIYPYRLAKLELFGSLLPAGKRLTCRVKASPFGTHQIRADVEIIDELGRTYARLLGWEDRRFKLPERLLALRISPAHAFLGVESTVPFAPGFAESDLTCCRVEGLTEEFLEAHGAIWSKVLVHLILGRREREYWDRLTEPKRRRDWLLGRAAAKDAVRFLLRRRFGLDVRAADVEILPDELGRPVVAGRWVERIGRRPVVSISHTEGAAVAVAASDIREQVGIDVERISNVGDVWDGHAFSAAERSLAEDVSDELRREWLLRFWCAKEASVKALGRGILGSQVAVVVRNADRGAGALEIALRDDVLAEFPDLRGSRIQASTACDGVYVTALVRCLRGETLEQES